jgi:hypothetical protein
MRPDFPEPFPKMLYKAFKRDNGKVQCLDPRDEDFSRRCYMTVQNDAELARAKGQGWREHPLEAIELFEQQERELAQAAAEAAFAAKRMSEKAQAEFKAAGEATADHVADVPAPKKRPGRPAKKAVAA